MPRAGLALKMMRSMDYYSKKKVMAAPKQLKKNRSARPTGWPNEFIIVMLLAHSFRDLTVNIFNYMFDKAIVPSLWLMAIVFALYKKNS